MLMTVTKAMLLKRGSTDIRAVIVTATTRAGEGRETDPNDYQTPDWRQASRGYQDWMGPVWAFQNAYRDGYRNGFRSGYLSVNRGWGDGDADDFPPVYQNSAARFEDRAYQIGFPDGASVAREDVAGRKPYNPNPRGRYDDEDHGYSRAYGNKRA
jgi:hypothetical protein